MTAAETVAGAEAGPKGIAGWLILPAVGACLGPVVNLAAAAYIARLMFMGYGFSGAVTALFAFHVISSLAMAAYSFHVARLFFRKKKETPQAFIRLLVASFAVVLAGVVFGAAVTGSMDAGDAKLIVQQALVMAIWIPYFRRSKRVANTFVE